MGTITATTGAEAIGLAFQRDRTLVKTFYEGTPVLRLLAPGIFTALGAPPAAQHRATGGDSIDWKLVYSGGTGHWINEGDALPAADNLEFADMTVSPKLVVNVRKITGHAKDFTRNEAYFNLLQTEMMGGMTQLLHRVEEWVVNQLEAAINDDTSYGGQTRSTVHADSDVTAGGSAALSLAMLSEAYETLTIDPRGVVYQPGDHIILSNPVQETAYTEVGFAQMYQADDETTGVNRPHNTAASDSVLDAGLMGATHEYNKLPWVSAATITNTLVLLLKRSDVRIEIFSDPAFEIIPLARTDDADQYEFRCNIGCAYLDPYRAGRIEALTT